MGHRRQDGKPCTAFGTGGKSGCTAWGLQPGEVSNSSAPVVANGVVVTGSTVIDFARATTPRGTVMAFDSYSGKPLWQFDPLLGHANSGSANVGRPCRWTANGLLYLPTSAASPDYYGWISPGDDLYANSVVALDLYSGAVRWYFQHVRHDLWDDTHRPAHPVRMAPARTSCTGAADQAGLRVRVQPPDRGTLWEITEQPVRPLQIPGSGPPHPAQNPSPPAVAEPIPDAGNAWGLDPWGSQRLRRSNWRWTTWALFTPTPAKNSP